MLIKSRKNSTIAMHMHVKTLVEVGAIILKISSVVARKPVCLSEGIYWL